MNTSEIMEAADADVPEDACMVMCPIEDTHDILVYRPGDTPWVTREEAEVAVLTLPGAKIVTRDELRAMLHRAMMLTAVEMFVRGLTVEGDRPDFQVGVIVLSDEDEG